MNGAVKLFNDRASEIDEANAAKKFSEIIKLKGMLEAENIPFEFHYMPDLHGFQICYPKGGDKRVCSIIEHVHSYGNERNLLEIMGLLTDEELECNSVVGGLSAENVLKRVKKAESEKENNNE